MRELREFDVVRVLRANGPASGGGGSPALPRAGDLGTIVDMSPGRSGAPVYAVESSDAEGRTAWLDYFARDQLEWVSSPEGA